MRTSASTRCSDSGRRRSPMSSARCHGRANGLTWAKEAVLGMTRNCPSEAIEKGGALAPEQALGTGAVLFGTAPSRHTGSVRGAFCCEGAVLRQALCPVCLARRDSWSRRFISARPSSHWRWTPTGTVCRRAMHCSPASAIFGRPGKRAGRFASQRVGRLCPAGNAPL
jgi:hypothetical protein